MKTMKEYLPLSAPSSSLMVSAEKVPVSLMEVFPLNSLPKVSAKAWALKRRAANKSKYFFIVFNIFYNALVNSGLTYLSSQLKEKVALPLEVTLTVNLMPLLAPFKARFLPTFSSANFL